MKANDIIHNIVKDKLKGILKPEFVSKPCWAHPVVIGGRLYLRDQDKLMCYDVRG